MRGENAYETGFLHWRSMTFSRAGEEVETVCGGAAKVKTWKQFISNIK